MKSVIEMIPCQLENRISTLFSCFHTFVLHILQVSLRRFTFYIFYQVSLRTLYIAYIFFVKR